jgi:hypothetical protein
MIFTYRDGIVKIAVAGSLFLKDIFRCLFMIAMKPDDYWQTG